MGTTVTFTATGADGSGAATYRFSVARSRGRFTVLRDYRPDNTFEWTPMEEGTYRVQVSVRHGDTPADERTAAHLSLPFRVVSRVTSGSAVVTATGHPLVALYSAPPCSSGSVYVEFRPAAGGDDGVPWQATASRPCSAGLSANFLVAGLLPETEYQVRHVIASEGGVRRAPVLSYTTGRPPVTPPLVTAAATVSPVVQAGGEVAAGVLLQSVVVAPPPLRPFTFATDSGGRLDWYYDPPDASPRAGYLFRPTPDQTMLLAAPSGVDGQLLREIDLSGNTVRETSIRRINEQLPALGMADAVTSFHHDARRLPDGRTAVLASVERLMEGAQGGTGAVDVLGDAVLVLDANWQVDWAWDSFDHLDVARKATLGGTCTHQAPGCPPIFLAAVANDWTHANSVAYSPRDGDLLVSLRHQDWVLKIDYRDGAGDGHVVWRLGKNGDFAMTSPDPYPWFSHQHDASYVGPNMIALFDNGVTRCQGKPDCHSRGQVVRVDEARRTATLALNVDLGGFAVAMGGAELLSSGSYLFTAPFPGPVTRSTVVRPDGIVEWARDTHAGVYRTFLGKTIYGLGAAGLP